MITNLFDSSLRSCAFHFKIIDKIVQGNSSLIALAMFPYGNQAFSRLPLTYDQHKRNLLGFGIADLTSNLFIPVVQNTPDILTLKLVVNHCGIIIKTF